MKDIILEHLFDEDRWKQAIAKGYDKDIRKDQLYQLAKPQVRAAIYTAIRDGKYRIAPPHTARIPKDTPGEFRTVFINEPADRVLLGMVNDILFKLCPQMIHPSCKSYRKGTGCGQVVREVSRRTAGTEDGIVGWKSDLSKYFDSVPLGYIDGVFDEVETICGESAVIRMLRDYYHSDLYFDTDGELRHAYQSLKQGCPVAAFLADAVLKGTDEKLSSLDGLYVRYSDDMLFIGPDRVKAKEMLEDDLHSMQMSLNPKKVEDIRPDRWFKFLGFSIRGRDISLSQTRIKTFQKEIESRTVKHRGVSPEGALRSVQRFLYVGDGDHSWATQVLGVVTVKKDIDTLNAFVMDALRAVCTGRGRIGGLGYLKDGRDGCIMRGKGRNVARNREMTSSRIEGYRSLGCIAGAMRCGRQVYSALVQNL